MRTLIAAFALLLALGVSSARAEPVTLNGSVTVSGTYVRLGDLFRNAGDKNDVVVAYAPAPGNQAVFGARWLYRLAQNHRLGWRPLTLQDRAVVRRDSQVITREEVEARILETLRERGEGRDVRIVLSNRTLKLYTAGDRPGVMAIEDLNVNRTTNRFSVIVVSEADNPAAKRIRVTGRVVEIAEVPVLGRRLLAGTVIKKEDIQWIDLPADRIQRDTITNVEDLIGMVPVRSLRDGRPIRAIHVRRPLLVNKGSLVTMLVKGPTMLLTAKGRAQENGSKGDTIRIANTQSKQVVEAKVTGPGTVTVKLANRLAMN